ncbi:MAG: hypothetical protein DWH81_02990 [Planctomycetota bacterium]|nr:MAG: hypothetical protein DWH81_02990 [Planctomycetota bacterium]
MYEPPIPMKWSRASMWMVLLFLVGTSAQAAAADWKAGISKVDITPQKPMWMAGYASRDHRATGTQTPLWGKVLVLEDARGQRVAAITLDLIGIDEATSNSLRLRITKEHGLERARIAIFCSHTHCGPVFGNTHLSHYTLPDEEKSLATEYTTGVLDKIVAAVGSAITDLTPAELQWSRGKVGFAVNRRTNKESEVPALRAAGELLGPVDHDVPILQVNCEDHIKAIVFGYACRATTLDFYQWCGDYPGYATQELEYDYPGTMAMFWAGCGGDQNPLPRGTVDKAEDYGERLAKEIESSLLAGSNPITGDLDVRYDEPEIAFASTPTTEQIEAQLKSTNIYEVGRAKQQQHEIATLGKVRSAYPYPVQTWKLGNGPVWVILSGEVLVDYSIRLKTELRAKYPDRIVWVAGYANDTMAYIPSLRVLKEGGYEGESSMLYYGRPSPWADTIEEQIVTTVQAQVQSLLGAPAPVQ